MPMNFEKYMQNADIKDSTHPASFKIGMRLSAALDDPNVCAEFKADIEAWMKAGMPVPEQENFTKTVAQEIAKQPQSFGLIKPKNLGD